MALDTKEVRDALEQIESDLNNEIDLHFGALIEPFDSLNEILESKFLKRFVVEYGKLRTKIVERIGERLSDLRDDLESHDQEIETAFEELVEEEDG